MFFNRFGFSEFNSDTYAPIAFKALVSVVGLSKDPEVKKLAEDVMNLQMFDHIIGSKSKRYEIKFIRLEKMKFLNFEKTGA